MVHEARKFARIISQPWGISACLASFTHFTLQRKACWVSHCAKLPRSPTHWHAETRQHPNEGLLFSPLHDRTFCPSESPDYPSLRASNEHGFIVRVLRAKRAPGRSLPSPTSSPISLFGGWPVRSPTARVQRGPSQAARCASTGDQQASLPLLYSNNLFTPALI